MSEEFIEYEGEASAQPSSSRAFGIAAGLLGLILILSLACAGWAWSQRGDDGGGTTEASEEVAAIETQNAIIAVTNEAVTATISAMETEAAQPTNTPMPPTNTPVPTSTPVPTNTPVVQPADGTEEADGADATKEAGDAMINTPTPIPGLGSGTDSSSGSSGTDSSSGSTGGDTGNAALPDTGIEVWGAVLAAFALIAIFFVARRLRSS